MIRAVLVIDTSYLLELFGVPGDSDPAFAQQLTERYRRAIEAGSRFYVPVAVLFELGNHIADVKDGRKRKRLAERFAEAVRGSIEEESPWIITPAKDRAIMLELGRLLPLCDRFAKELALVRLGLTDTTVIDEARRLKEGYRAARLPIHIWTRHRALKGHEPDPEHAPLL